MPYKFHKKRNKIAENTFESVFGRALDLLTRQMMTEKVLTQKLVERGFEVNLVKDAVKKCKELRYLSDEKYAEMFVDSFIRFKSYGYFMLVQKLKLKGVPQDIITKVMDEYFTVNEELLIAKKWWNKTLKNKKPRPDELNKYLMALSRRGFRSEVVSKLKGLFREGA
jgi:regulatory protein